MWIALLLLAGGNLTLGCALGLKLNVNRFLRFNDLVAPPVEPVPVELVPAEHLIAPVEPSSSVAPTDDQSNSLIQQLQGWLSGMNQNIGEHNSRLEVLGGQIKGCASSDPEAIAMLVAQIVEANNTLHGELNAARNEIVEQQQQLERRTTEARTDALSGLANRRAFDDALQQGLKNAEIENTPMCLMMVDVDHFKKFNDTHGHQAGDAVLRQVAKVLATGARSQDLVARYGGEEFSIIFPNTPMSEASQLAEELRAAVAQRKFNFEGTELQVTVSAGLAMLEPADSIESLTRRADSALYAAKEGGRNRGFYSEGGAFKPIRRSERHVVESVQMIAPLDGNEVPDEACFYAARCLDVSTGGFAFVWPERPAMKRLVIRLGTAQDFRYMAAEVANISDLGSEATMRYRVGCKFTGRFLAAADGQLSHHGLESSSSEDSPESTSRLTTAAAS
jgi:diguanylate cyclase